MRKRIKIGNRWVGDGEPTFVVAEVGQNHNGDVGIAKKLIDLSAAAGVDAVKFCKRNLKYELTEEAYDAPYENPNSFGPTYGKHREALEFSPAQHKEVQAHCRRRKVIYFSSVCDPLSADQMEALKVPVYKIASRDLTNLPLLDHVARKKTPIILSTGMSTLAEIDGAVNAIARHHDRLILLQCVSQYPADPENLNIRAMLTMRERYDCLTGYSCHNVGVLAPTIAAVMGACVVEKHVTLSRAMKGTDQAGSLEPDGLYRVVRYIRYIPVMMGQGKKDILPVEVPSRRKLARSVVPIRDIGKGEKITIKMLGLKSPGTGLAASHVFDLVGKRAARDLQEDELVGLQDFA